MKYLYFLVSVIITVQGFSQDNSQLKQFYADVVALYGGGFDKDTQGNINSMAWFSAHTEGRLYFMKGPDQLGFNYLSNFFISAGLGYSAHNPNRQLTRSPIGLAGIGIRKNRVQGMISGLILRGSDRSENKKYYQGILINLKTAAIPVWGLYIINYEGHELGGTILLGTKISLTDFVEFFK